MMNTDQNVREAAQRDTGVPIWYQQYVAVKRDVQSRYPDADWVSVTRSGYNRMSARVEARDVHLDVFYWFAGGRIDDSWVVASKRACNENCLHLDYPQEDPHEVLPQSWWDKRF